MKKNELIMDFLQPVLILLFISIIFWLTNLDIYLESLFYKQGSGWYLKDYFLVQWLYDYGQYPGIICSVTGLVGLIFSFIIPRWRRYRKVFAFLFLLMLIGSLLLVNFTFKDHWGRPRPREIVQFGGEYDFVEHWLMGPTGPNSSFPSGHAAAAFYMIFPYFLLRDNRRKLAQFFLITGVGYGLLMGLGRMIQGGHFASDVIYSGGFMYLTGLVLYYILRFNNGLYLKSKR